MADNRPTVIVFNRNPVAFVDLTLEDDFDCGEVENAQSVIEYGRPLQVSVIVEPGVDLTFEDDSDCNRRDANRNLLDNEDGTSQVTSHVGPGGEDAASCSENTANAAPIPSFVVHQIEENVSHSASESAIVAEMEAIQTSTTSTGAFAEQTDDPITGAISANALPQCEMMIPDCSSEAEKPFRCPVCSRKFKTKIDQTQHIDDNLTFAPYVRIVRCPKMLSCLFDSKSLCERRVYHDHWKQIQYRCRKCPKIYENNCSLLRHVHSVHLRSKRKQLRESCRR